MEFSHKLRAGMPYNTIPEMFYNVCDRLGDSKPAFVFKNEGDWQSVTHSVLKEQVEGFALALLELGIRKGDRIGIVSENRIEWIIASFAISIIGAVDVPIFPILSAKQEEFIFLDSAAVAIIVSNNFQLGKVLQFKENVQSLRHIIVMNKDFNSDQLTVKSMHELIKHGSFIRKPQDRRKIFDECCSKVSPEDLLTIIYTSGTTGTPKGVMLSQNNVVSNIKGALDAIGDLSQETTLSYLPFCHSYERTTGFYALFVSGATISIAESIEAVASNIRDLRPTLITTVPKLLETIKKKMYVAMEKEPVAKQKMFNWAINVGIKRFRNSQNGKFNPLINAQNAIAERLVFSKLREKLGSRLSKFISGGAALTSDVGEFFFAIGIGVYQGYGLTEASPIATFNRIDDNELGTIGKALCNVETKLTEEGEILVKGPNVMKGYWNDKVATDEAIDSDGWLYTGDIGIITERGNIKITDRKKHIFVSSGGKNIAPQPIEQTLSQSIYIDDCFLIGERREYCTALLTPNFENLRNLANEFGIEYSAEGDLITNQRIINHIKKDLDFLQKDLSKFERIRKFSLLSKPFSVESGELSPKMSVKRHVVERNYTDLIEKMYNGE